MKAAVLTKLDSPLELADVGLTEPRYGQVVVRVLASGICGAQLQEIRGHKDNAGYIPHLMGHEGCGIVEAIGPGVRTVREWDKVVLHWRKGDGIESEPPNYIYGDRIISSGRVTTFSEFALVSENRVTRVPFDVPEELCALMGCGLSTALGTLERDAQLRMGESLLVVGVGGLGCNLLRAGKLMNATPVFGMDINPAKKDLADSLGASDFCSTWPEVREDMRVWGIRGFEIIVDTTGEPQSMEQALMLLRPNGRFIMVGQPAPGLDVTIHNARHFFEGDGKRILATQGGGFQPHADIPRYVRMHEKGLLDIGKIVTHRLKLDDINHAIELVRQGDAGRIIIRP